MKFSRVVLCIGMMFLLCSCDSKYKQYQRTYFKINDGAEVKIKPASHNGVCFAHPSFKSENNTLFKSGHKSLNLAKHILAPTETIADNSSGKKLYAKACVYCHGQKGDGRGRFIAEGIYLYKPKGFSNVYFKEYTKGQLFHVISAGHKTMPSHKSILTDQERWQLIAFIYDEFDVGGTSSKP